MIFGLRGIKAYQSEFAAVIRYRQTEFKQCRRYKQKKNYQNLKKKIFWKNRWALPHYKIVFVMQNCESCSVEKFIFLFGKVIWVRNTKLLVFKFKSSQQRWILSFWTLAHMRGSLSLYSLSSFHRYVFVSFQKNIKFFNCFIWINIIQSFFHSTNKVCLCGPVELGSITALSFSYKMLNFTRFILFFKTFNWRLFFVCLCESKPSSFKIKPEFCFAPKLDYHKLFPHHFIST